MNLLPDRNSRLVPVVGTINLWLTMPYRRMSLLSHFTSHTKQARLALQQTCRD